MGVGLLRFFLARRRCQKPSATSKSSNPKPAGVLPGTQPYEGCI